MNIDEKRFQECEWCNGSGDDGGGYNVCPDCESTGLKGGRYATEDMERELDKLISTNCGVTERRGIEMYQIKLKKKANGDFDEVINIEQENKAHHEYCQHMKGGYYFGRLVKIVNGKEERIASFCNSTYA